MTPDQHDFLADAPLYTPAEELAAIAREVVKPLHGLPLCDALSVLDHHARSLLLSGHLTDLTTPRYRRLLAAEGETGE